MEGDIKLGQVLVIAEKRDQAKKLAAPYEYNDKQSYFELKPCSTFPNGGYISWCAGHIVELVDPEGYDEKYAKWKLEDLPIVPEKMKYKVSKSKANLFKVIKELLNKPQVSEIILAGDPGREGSLIGYNVIKLLGNKKPVKRLWAKSLTQSAVKEAFDHLLPEKEKYGLYEEAYARSVADWLIGMSLSRAYTLRMQKKKYDSLISIGRIQTPLLKLIIDRYEAIGNFTPKPYYEVFADFNISGHTYRGKWYRGDETSIPEASIANKLALFCKEKTAKVERTSDDEQIEYAPHLYALSDIQAEANKKFKFSISQTDEALQELYLSEYISYPRSDSRYLTEQDAAMVPMYLNLLKQCPEYHDIIPSDLPSIVHNKRYTNNELVSDHYAIIITDKIPNLNELNDTQRKLYDLIAKRLIAVHYPPAKYKKSVIHTYVDDAFSFITVGRTVIDLGWREIYRNEGNQQQEEVQEGEQEIPNILEGSAGIVQVTEVKELMTKPPAKLSEGDLIPLMKNAGRQLEDKEAGQILHKVNGLGTEATRAGIIRNLIDKKYIQIQKNTVYPTELGKLIIKAIGSSMIGSAALTAEWETKLAEVSKGNVSPQTFIKEVVANLHLLLKECEDNVELMEMNNGEMPDLTQAVIPKTIASKKALSNTQAVTPITSKENVPKAKQEAKNTNTNLQSPAPTRQSSIQSKEEKPLSKTEIIELFEGVTIRQQIEERKTTNPNDTFIGNCPECEVGAIVDRNTFYGCTSYKMGCRFSLNKMIAGKELTPIIISELLAEGQTGLIRGFKKKDKNEYFDAVLELKDRKISFKFPNRNALKIPTNLLLPDKTDKTISEEQKEQIKELIEMCKVLNLNSTLKGLVNSPQVSRFELEPNNMNVNMKKFSSYKANFQMALKAEKIAMQIPIPGTNLIGIEVPSPTPYTVNLREMLEDKAFLAKKEPLSFPVGVDLHGNNIYADIAKMPHCLIAGETGSGKSVCINSIIISLLYSNTPDEIKLILIDPKKVELSAYSEIPHLMQPVITDMRFAERSLLYVLKEMERRYDLMKQMKVKKIEDYNSKIILENTGQIQIPYVVVVIDEFASLMLTASDTEIPEIITRLVQEARAAGIHLILSTQRPISKIFPTTIKANLPTRLAFSVNSTVESMVVLDEGGAENLLGKGDMLYKTNRGIKRLVSAYISDAEINRVVAYILMKYGKNEFGEDSEDD